MLCLSDTKTSLKYQALLVKSGHASVSYLYTSVGTGQLGELNTASIIHIPQTHLSGNTRQSLLCLYLRL